MKAAVYDAFNGPLSVREVDDPVPTAAGVVVRVMATGVCRSDWHGWRGHDPDITLPHVPGHEIAGIVETVGSAVGNWRGGERVTLPFVCGCGICPQCLCGHQQVCDKQFQPGFTAWGSYAQYVAIDYADGNLVALPEDLDFVTAASLGCRFATAFRAVVAQGGVQERDWVAVHGCGGLGLAAVIIALAHGAHVIAIDAMDDRLLLAQSLGAAHIINVRREPNVSQAVRQLSEGGAHISIDAVGRRQACIDSIAGLRKRGRHVQVGLLVGPERRPAIPMELVVARELAIFGSHGMQAHEYPKMIEMICDGRVKPTSLIGKTIDLELAARNFSTGEGFDDAGVVVIDKFA
jgi:alcohol dehydrogenase